VGVGFGFIAAAEADGAGDGSAAKTVVAATVRKRSRRGDLFIAKTDLLIYQNMVNKRRPSGGDSW
jgi:hypothetical protein